MSAQFNNCHSFTTSMGAKPYSPGHIGAVAANYKAVDKTLRHSTQCLHHTTIAAPDERALH